MNQSPQLDSGDDPPPPSAPSPEEGAEITDLKDQFEQQQILIVQLKEMLRKTDQGNVTPEKVDRYATTLSKMTERAKKSKLKKESIIDSGGSKQVLDAPVNAKISLLKKQLEENKAKLVERGKNQKGIEEMVTQLKAQFDDSLQLIHDTSSNFLMLETKTDYSKESSSEELYNVLITKEKKISDLNSKVQKLEANVLDLQENLREKDCVIDARTKAITLMTESLSKKGRNTQEALDETKEQMRNMQEDFVKLENEMKARQMKLLDDLRAKNLEIAELQDMNEVMKNQAEINKDYLDSDMSQKPEDNALKKEIKELLDKIKVLELSNNDLTSQFESLKEVNNTLKEDFERQSEELNLNLSSKNNEIHEYKLKIAELEATMSKLNTNVSKDDDSVLTKLKKDLDDSNKNLIKIKAEHKKKIKTLNKKIDTFKKIGDLNAHIVELTAVNDSLEEKIALLEEEKGSYQLKMMDFFSKDSPSGLNSEELEARTNELITELNMQLKEIEDLKIEKTSLQEQIDSLNEKLMKLSDIQNEKVTSEMTSIQFEELVDKLQKENSEILAAKQNIELQNDELLDKIEILSREKTDIQSKLDQYIQENIELIDKLEKLSAEKVSSAESIEIVENLTHQEKLELEEYQKNLDMQSGKLKMSEEHLEGTPDLNDSVSRLTEETSELLQKIELFTIERREVMEKMETLTAENGQLSLRVKQVENNRDLLTETYEQLQSDKEKLDEKIENLEKENNNLKDELRLVKKEYNVEENKILNQKLYELEGEYLRLVEESRKVQQELTDSAKIVHERDNLILKVKESENKINELKRKLDESEEEIKTYEMVIEDNKEEFIKSASQINNLKEIIHSKEAEIVKLTSEIDNLQITNNEFENEKEMNKNYNRKIEFLQEEISSLKNTLEDSLTQISDYERELDENSNHIKELSHQLKELDMKNRELQNMLDEENEKQKLASTNINETIEHLRKEINIKDQTIQKISCEMKEKYILLQKQTDSNTESLEDIREPLQKKINDLTSKNNTLVEKMKKIAANLKKKTQNCQDLEHQLSSNQEKLKSELNEKDLRIVELERKMEELRREASTCQVEVNQLKHLLGDKELVTVPVQASGDSRCSISLQEELFGSSIAQVMDSESSNDAMFSKIQELQLIKETQETEISNYKERITNLEELLSKMDERRESLEQKTNELGVQLQEKSQSFEEISKTEDMLEERVRNLLKHQEEAEKKIEELMEKTGELSCENEKLKECNAKFKHKMNIAQERVNELLEIVENSSHLEQELEKLKNQNLTLEQEIRRVEMERLQCLETGKCELEKLDNDWQAQYDVISKDKLELSTLCEKLNERISELSENEQNFSEKIIDLEFKLQQSSKLQEASDHECATQQEEVKKLKSVIKDMQKEIDEYSKELKDMKALEEINAHSIAELDHLKEENKNLISRLNELSAEILALEGLKDFEKNNLVLSSEVERFRVENEGLKLRLEEFLLKDNMSTVSPNKSSERIEAVKTGIEGEHTLQTAQPLFVWQSEDTDPFIGLHQNISQIEDVRESLAQEVLIPEKDVPNSSEREELLQKIRTLEFMLKNVENERDEVISQSSYLSNELMRVVYEKEGQRNIQDKSISNEHEEDVNLKPASEPLCIKKTAYLCYPDASEPDNQGLLNIESQVLPRDCAEDSKESLATLRDIEFTGTQKTSSHGPFVQEDPITRKHAYLCFPDSDTGVELQTRSSDTSEKPTHSQEEPTISEHPLAELTNQMHLDTFGVDEDGWGWNSEEARLEEKHNKEFESNPLRMKIQELEEKVKAMELQHENETKEYQELQVKFLKLMKKFKEVKAKNDKLQQGEQNKNSELLDLETAIQEELKVQIENLEKRISEVVNELTKEKKERSTLESKVESLSAMNQRMSVLKEKQDIEMLMCQRQAEELKQKLDQVEWNVGNSPEKKQPNSKNFDKCREVDIEKLQNTVEELKETLKELTLDNEDLQALLEEQRQMRINAERSKSVQPMMDNMKTESEYMDIVNQKRALENEIDNVTTDKKRIQEELNAIIKRNDEQLLQFGKLQESQLQLQTIIEERDDMITQLSSQLEQSHIENEKLLTQKSGEEIKLQELQHKVSMLEEYQNKMISDFQEKSSSDNWTREEKEKLLEDLNEKDREIVKMKQGFEKETICLKHELELQIKNTEKLIVENEILSVRQKELEEQIVTLQEELKSKENEIVKLNQDWQILVDQRGSDVAESWKLHLDSVETEFSQAEQQLKKEINDMEEKCNALVNENNELRKNVDTEIRNEVDKVSALQQQITERQNYIHELSRGINDKQLQIENLEKGMLLLQNTIGELKANLEEKNVKINELSIVIEATQNQFDEKRIIVEKIVKTLEEQSSLPIPFDSESILKELRAQLEGSRTSSDDWSKLYQDLASKDDTISELHKDLCSKSEKINSLQTAANNHLITIDELQKDVASKDDRISKLHNDLSSKTEEVSSHQVAANNYLIAIEELQKQIDNANVTETVSNLNTAINERDIALIDKSMELETMTKELNDSQTLIDKFKEICSENEIKMKDLTDQLNTKEETITNLEYQLQHTQSLKENENENVQNLQCSLRQYQLQYDELRTNLEEKCSLVDIMTGELERQQKIHIEREAEVEKLKMHVEEMKLSLNVERDQLDKEKIESTESQSRVIQNLTEQLNQKQFIIDELVSERQITEQSVNTLLLQLQEQQTTMEGMSKQIESYRCLNDELSRKIDEFEELQKTYQEQIQHLQEENKQVAELKTIIEDQVLKIEELGKRLFQKSNDYDSLIAEIEVIRKSDSHDQSMQLPMGRGQLIGPTSEDELNEWVTRSELDIALYMLHQRDVRCEELTVELTQLLEERDTLQLRLSNAIREKEEYRKIAHESGSVVDIPPITTESSPSRGAIPKGRVSEIVLSSSGTELATEAQESLVKETENQLELKLTELKNISYKKDKTLLDEQQQRRLQQISIMQQHMDEASRLPPEAAARLVDANYTLSRDVQSPSKVLLNWLWGRSTPKVNEL